MGVLIAGALVVLGWMALQVGAFAGMRDQVAVTVRFHDAAGVQVGAQVAVAGVPVGTVTGLVVDHDVALVSLGLDTDAHIRVDALAQVRSRSVLGEKYVALEPQARDTRLVADGDALQSGGEQTEIDEMVSTMGPLLEAVDPEAISRLVDALSQALADDPDRVTRMMANADAVLANSAAASQELPVLVSEGRATLSAVRRSLGGVDERVAQLGAVADRADGLLSDASGAVEGLPSLVSEVESTVIDAHALVVTLNGSTASLDEILENLSGFDEREIRRLLREEGILVRLRPARVSDEPSSDGSRRGSVER